MIRYIAEYWSEREKGWVLGPDCDGPQPLTLDADGRIPLTIKTSPDQPCLRWVGSELVKYDVPEIVQIYRGVRGDVDEDDYDDWWDDFYEDDDS